MWILLIPVFCASLEISQIPESGSPPAPRLLVASVFDATNNRLIFLGGEGSEGSNDLSSTLSAFNLNTFTWNIIPSKMGIVPPGLKDTNIYFRESDNKLFVFGGLTSKGVNTVVYSFNLKRLYWNIEIMDGVDMVPTIKSSFSFFSYKDTEYIAFYGGNSDQGLIDHFYLIDAEKMVVKKMPKNGDHPGMRIMNKSFFYNETYYMFGVDFKFANISLFKFDLENETWSYVQTLGEKPPDMVNQEVFIKNDSLYLINGVLAGILFPQLSFYRFDFSTSDWVKLQSSLPFDEWSYYHTTTKVNEKVYKAFGKSNKSLLNSVTMIELGDEMAHTILSPQYISPEPRRNHLSFMSYKEMYIYGGITDEGIFLKDLWKYNFERKIWIKVDYTGTPPLIRENMAFVSVSDIGLFVFGGQSGNEFFNDIYFYEQKNSVWVKYSGYKSAPNSRYASCVVYSKQKLYVIGGQNNQFSFSDIWTFDSLENTFILLEDSLPFSIAFHKCWSVEKGSQLYIYVMGGKSFDGITTKKVHLITVTSLSDTKYSVKTDELLYDYYLYLYNTALVVSGNSGHLMIGTAFEGTVNSTMVSYDICKNQISFLNLPSKYGVFSHSAVHYGKSIYVFGGGYSVDGNQIDNSATNFLYNFSLPEILNCSLGLFEEDGECKSCPIGTYGNYNSRCITDNYCSLCSIIENTCSGCDFGKFLDKEGSTSKYTCSACPHGKFSNKLNSTKCLDCSESSYCPIGSTKPLNYNQNYKFSSVQPAVYESKKMYASLFVNNIWYTAIVIIFVLFLNFLLFSKLRHSFIKIDLFTDSHPQKLNVPVIYRRTNFGGLFSIIFIILFFSIVISAYITYTYDNIVETRTLVPLVTVDEKTEAKEFIVYSKFHEYGGECVGQGQGNCNSELIINETGISYKEKYFECELIGKNCLVKIVYQDIEIGGNFEIYYKMKEILSYANLITVNITVSTGIPEGNSQNFIPIYPDPEEFIFRGTSPTVLNFETIPTFFKSESRKWPSSDKGFHLRYDKTPQYGSMIDLVDGFLGMIAGVLGGLGTVMKRLEHTSTGLQSKFNDKKKLKKMIKIREQYDDFLSGEKVMPEYIETPSNQKTVNETFLRSKSLDPPTFSARFEDYKRV